MKWTIEKMEETRKLVLEKAMVDVDFRNKLLESPCKAIEEVAGLALPEGYKIQVIEQDPDCQKAFILPPMVAGEFSDEDMEMIAGGSCGAYVCGVEGGACGAEGSK